MWGAGAFFFHSFCSFDIGHMAHTRALRKTSYVLSYFLFPSGDFLQESVYFFKSKPCTLAPSGVKGCLGAAMCEMGCGVGALRSVLVRALVVMLKSALLATA